MKKQIKNIFYSSRFKKSFQKLPTKIQKKACRLEKIFRKNCFDPQLKTHRLKGKYRNYFSFSITYSYRIVFEFYEDGVLFIDIGTHEIYK